MYEIQRTEELLKKDLEEINMLHIKHNENLKFLKRMSFLCTVFMWIFFTLFFGGVIAMICFSGGTTH